MDNKYGYFSEDGKEYNIINPDTPRNWYNYLWNDRYITYFSQAGAGESFLQDNLGRRLALVKDRGFFILENGKSYGISGLPVNQEREEYLCTHMRGSSNIYTKIAGLSCNVGIVVPLDADCELWGVTIKNTWEEKRQIKLIGFCLTDFDGVYVRQGYNTGVADFDKELNSIVAHKYACFESEEQKDVFGYVFLSQPADKYDCTQNAVIGPYGSVANPTFIDRGGLKNSSSCGEGMAFALEKNLTLEKGEEATLLFVSGIVFNKEDIKKATNRFSDYQSFLLEKEKAIKHFNDIVDQVDIETPDKKLDNLFEWLKHQSNMGSLWARVRHNGFRDMTSDTECLANINPELALERFLRILTYQYSNGYAPRTILDGEIRDNNFSDNTVWLTFTAYQIIKETGRTDILDMVAPFNDSTQATVFEHLKRSVEFLYNFRGLHGLIKIWGGDWNDCMGSAGLQGKGVSVWLSFAWFRANKLFGELCELYGKKEEAQISKKRQKEMQQIIEEYGWDGEYYLCAYNDWDEKIGSKENEEGKMFLIPQLWAVLSGVSEQGREKQAMDMVEKNLSTPLGTVISIPPYSKYNDRIGFVTQKPPGVHENGGVYLHTIAWKIAADAILKRADKVEEDLNTILPFNNKIVRGRAEPYILCNSYFGIQTGYRYGTPGQSWRTASGQWLQKAVVNYVFGLMPQMDGLKIDPCLPKSWKECKIKKVFRGCTYNIKYINGGTKVKEILVNGKKLQGDILPVTDAEVLVVTE